MRTVTSSLTLALCLVSHAVVVHGGADLVYEPINPSFGGDPFNGSFLLNNAQAQNKFKDPDRSRGDEDPSEQFLRDLEGRLYRALADQVVEAIFGEDASESGTVTFDDQIINFENGLDGITLEIIDTSTGNTTLIEIPNLQVD